MVSWSRRPEGCIKQDCFLILISITNIPLLSESKELSRSAVYEAGYRLGGSYNRYYLLSAMKWYSFPKHHWYWPRPLKIISRAFSNVKDCSSLVWGRVPSIGWLDIGVSRHIWGQTRRYMANLSPFLPSRASAADDIWGELSGFCRQFHRHIVAITNDI